MEAMTDRRAYHFAFTTPIGYAAIHMRISQLHQIARFLAVGALNTAFGYGVFALLIWMGLAPFAALLIATILGVLFNFMTTGRIVFGNRDIGLLGRFVIVYTLVYLINLGLLGLVRQSGLSSVTAQGVCLFFMVPISFVLQKLFVFKEVNHADN
jgi:putative flippase GtrA